MPSRSCSTARRPPAASGCRSDPSTTSSGPCGRDARPHCACGSRSAPFAGRRAADWLAELVRRRGLDPASSPSISASIRSATSRARGAVLPFAEWPRHASRDHGEPARGRASPRRRCASIPAPTTRPARARRRNSRPRSPPGVAYLRALEPAHRSRGGPRRALVPPRRRRRRVPDRREVPGPAPPLGRVEEACGLEPQAHPPRRRDRMAHDDAPRPVGQPPAHHRRGVLGRNRRRGQRHGSALHRRRSACPTPSRGVSPATRSTSCSTKSNLWRVADPAAGAGGFEALTDGLCEQGLGAVPGDRARRRDGREPPRGRDPGAHRRDPGRARAGGRDAPGADHRHERVPEHP